FFFFFQAEDGIRDRTVTGVQTCALPILNAVAGPPPQRWTIAARSCFCCAFGLASGTRASTSATLRSRYTDASSMAWLGITRRVRSEERRVGKECRCGGWPVHEKRKERYM